MGSDLSGFERFLTVKQAAKFLGIAETTVRNWDRSGKMRAARHPLNHYRLYQVEDLECLLNEIDPTGPRHARRGKERALDENLEILLIEDNPRDVELIIHAFKMHGIANRVRILGDGEAALEYIFRAADTASASLPKLILLDMRLPKVDGSEVLRRLKTDSRTRAIPVVALTSSSEGPEVRKTYQLGVNGYLVKSVDYRNFTNAIGALGRFWLGANHVPEAGVNG